MPATDAFAFEAELSLADDRDLTEMLEDLEQIQPLLDLEPVRPLPVPPAVKLTPADAPLMSSPGSDTSVSSPDTAMSSPEPEAPSRGGAALDKKADKRARNRAAAARCRERKRQREEMEKMELQSLRTEVVALRAETTRLRALLDMHGIAHETAPTTGATMLPDVAPEAAPHKRQRPAESTGGIALLAVCMVCFLVASPADDDFVGGSGEGPRPAGRVILGSAPGLSMTGLALALAVPAIVFAWGSLGLGRLTTAIVEELLLFVRPAVGCTRPASPLPEFATARS